MSDSNEFYIATLPGDGIGPEITGPATRLLARAAERVGGFSLRFDTVQAGAAFYQVSGRALPRSSLNAVRRADAIYLACMGLPDVRYPDGTEIAPQIDLRIELGLFAGVRPIRTVPGVPSPLSDPRAAALDLVLIRESTEGLFASFGKGQMIQDSEAREILVITRATSERLFDFAFALAEQRRRDGHPGRLTCVDKANVFQAFAFFRQIFRERAEARPEIAADTLYVDAVALALIQRPWDFDVLVTENMFGDILSDLGAALVGGLGFAPSADIGRDHAVFQPCHGSAPDIAGRGLANPTAMFRSGAMMLEWLGEKHACPEAKRAGRLVSRAVDGAFAAGHLRSCETGGEDGTDRITGAVRAMLEELDPEAPEAGTV